jgi:predicted nucleotidyltransferase
MLDLTRCDPRHLRLVDDVVTGLLANSTRLRDADVLLVGAHCRDLLQRALGHDFSLRTTSDIDLGLAIADWAAYDELTARLRPVGHTGIRYRVANLPADLMPFGPIENPPGTVAPAARRETMSVWAFTEVFGAALPLALPGGSTIRIPTVAGYAALKLKAWVDRSADGQYKDADDIATILSWYTESTTVHTRLYETGPGNDILTAEDIDDQAAAAHVLGADIAEVIGGRLVSELAAEWPGPRHEFLYHSMSVTGAPGWTRAPQRWRDLVHAMERGLGLGQG